MSDNIILDLDILKPEPKYIKLDNKKIDISFIPSKIAFRIMKLKGDLVGFVKDEKAIDKIKKNDEQALKAFDVAIELVAAITECQYDYMTKDWLLAKLSVLQIQKLAMVMQEQIFQEVSKVNKQFPPEAGVADVKKK